MQTAPGFRILIAFCLNTCAQAQLPITYDAESGIDPVSQGWTGVETQFGSDADFDNLVDPHPSDSELSGNVGQLSSPILAWQINDQNTADDKNNPRYAKDLSVAEQDLLISDGWVLTAIVRAVRSGGPGDNIASGFIGWPLLKEAAANTTGTDKRVGMYFRVGDNNEFIAYDDRGFDEPSIRLSLPENSAAEYHVITLRGNAGETTYTWDVDGIAGPSLPYDMLSDDSFTISDRKMIFSATSSPGLGEVANYSFIGLKVAPPVRTVPGTLFVNASASGADDGTGWGDAFTSLQDALGIAIPGDEIWVARGTYKPGRARGQSFAMKTGVATFGGFAGTESALDERDPVANSTILSGVLSVKAVVTDNSFHVVTADGVDSSAVLDGFTISGGYADGFTDGLNFFDTFGGGLLVTGDSSPTVNHCSFHENFADFGGAIHVRRAGLTLTNCSFRGNSAARGGGAIFDLGSSPELENCSFLGNTTGGGGGGILIISPSTPKLTNCSFHGNSATGSGGAIENGATSSLTLTNCVIWNNAAAGVTNSVSASIEDLSDSSTFSHCLVQNFTKAVLDNTGSSPNTNFEPVDPQFLSPVEPATVPTPTHVGNLRLHWGSPAIGVGDDAANSSASDIDGKPRKVGTIDLGAYEHQGILHVDAGVTDSDTSGSSWANAYQSLQAALTAATCGQEIWVAAGTYRPGTLRADSFHLKNRVAISGGFAGHELRFDQRNLPANPTVLSGDLAGDDGDNFDNNSENAYHVLVADGVDRTAIIDGFTITAGNANGSSMESGGAGLLCNELAFPTLVNCSFQKNSATRAGAIYIILSTPGVTFTNCSFLGNLAVHEGGAIFDFSSSAEFANCSFVGNFAGSSGGAIHIHRGSPVLSSCTFHGNSSAKGGAIFNVLSPTTRLTNCVIWKNADSGVTTSAEASIEGPFDGTYSHCLVENFSKAALDNTNGSPDTNLEPVDPRFALTADPLTAPNTIGDLRLLTGSPAIDAGLDSANDTSTDLAGNPRVSGASIDLGAYEALDAAALALDTDGDGITDGIELAIGTGPDLSDLQNPRHLRFAYDAAGTPQLTFGFDPAQQAVIVLLLTRSTDLTNFETIISTNAATAFELDPGETLLTFSDPTITDETVVVFYRLEVRLR